VDALRQIDGWPAGRKAAGAVRVDGRRQTRGETTTRLPWASVSKLVSALAVLVAAEEGIVELDEPAGPPGSTVRHLLAHTSGLPFEGTSPIGRPGQRRVYSNAGFGVLGPLGTAAELVGDAGSGVEGTLDDLLAVGRELLAPTVVAAETLAEAAAIQFPGLPGILPGFGRQEPNDWGLGMELRDSKSPHWTGSRNSEQTFGHFGRSGTFLWVDPEPGIALACLTDLEFGGWAKRAWPELSDAVLEELSR